MTIHELDSILDQAENIEDFLSSKNLIDSYFTSCQNYYGKDKFSHTSFGSILSQLSNQIKKMPELGNRLWQKINSGIFNIDFNCEQALGRNIHADSWNEYLEAWLTRLSLEFSGSISMEPNENFLLFFEQALHKMQKEIVCFEKTLEGNSNKPQLRKLRENFYKEICNRKSTNQLAAASVYFAITKRIQPASTLRHCDADPILKMLTSWRIDPRLVLKHEWRTMSDGLVSAIRRKIPSARELLKNEHIFPPCIEQSNTGNFYPSKSLRAGLYQFEAVPRSFHGLWRGLATTDCMALSPRRWGLSALDGGHTIFIRSGSSFYGSIFIIPIYKENKRFGLLEFWSPILSLRPKFKNSDDVNHYPFVQHVLSEFAQNRNSIYDGFCICLDAAVDNFATNPAILECPIFRMGKAIGTSSEVFIRDSLSELSNVGTVTEEIEKQFSQGFIYSGKSINASSSQITLI